MLAKKIGAHSPGLYADHRTFVVDFPMNVNPVLTNTSIPPRFYSVLQNNRITFSHPEKRLFSPICHYYAANTQKERGNTVYSTTLPFNQE
jgi:hypothetical protein